MKIMKTTLQGNSAMKIPDAKAAVDKTLENFQKYRHGR